MSIASVLKGLGYLVSTLSVVLLGIVAWKSASEQPLLFICLILGMLSSVTGMGLRWISHRLEQRQKEAEGKAATLSDVAPDFRAAARSAEA